MNSEEKLSNFTAVAVVLLFSRPKREMFIRALFGNGDISAKIHPERVTVDKLPLQCAYIAEAYALSEREHEVMNLIVLLYTTTMIAEELYISPATVRDYRDKLHKKLNVHTKGDIGNLVHTVTDKQLLDARLL